jgi:glycine cleavage system H protein
MNQKPKNEGRFPVIPDGEKRCIWMDQGVVSYKICDRDFDCENCALDIGLRGRVSAPASHEWAAESHSLPETEPFSKRAPGSRPLRFSLLSQMERLPTEGRRYFHPEHTWMHVTAPDRVYVGVDTIVATILGSVDDIVLPVLGQGIQRGESCGQVIQGARAFSIRAPVSGQIVDTNTELHAFPNKLVLDSMGGGWLCCLAPDNLDDDLQFCRAGDAVFPWYMKELEWLDSILASSLQRHQGHLGQTMYDGGELSRNLRDLLPAEEYRHLVLSFIGKPSGKG